MLITASKKFLSNLKSVASALTGIISSLVKPISVKNFLFSSLSLHKSVAYTLNPYSFAKKTDSDIVTYGYSKVDDSGNIYEKSIPNVKKTTYEKKEIIEEFINTDIQECMQKYNKK